MNFKSVFSNDVDLIPIECYSKTFEHGFKMNMHGHKFIEIMYAENSGFQIKHLSSNVEKHSVILEHQFVIIGSEVPHELIIKNKAKICNIELMPQTSRKDTGFSLSNMLNNLENFCAFKNSFNDIIVINDTENFLPTLKKINSCLSKNFDSKENYYYFQSLVLLLFIDISRCYQNRLYNVQNFYVAKIMSVIHSSFSSDLSPQTFAKSLNISESYLHRLFKKEIGKSVVQYLNELRAEKARQLLVTTNHPIIDIAIEVGFNNRQNFGQVFNKIFGVSPAYYRKHNKNSEYSVELVPPEQVTYIDENDK